MYVICHWDDEANQEVCGVLRLTREEAMVRLDRLQISMPFVEHWLKEVR